jgi:hypothetical protein
MKTTLLRTLSIFALLICFTTNIQAQRVKGNGNLIEKTRQVGDFEALGVSGSFDVFLVKGQEGKVIVNVEENLEPYLETEVQNGTLKVRWKKGSNVRTTKNTKVTVHFDALNGVALSGSGDIISRDPIKTEELDIAVAGSGDIRLEVDAEESNAAVSGSGDIELSGTSKAFGAAVAGSGDIKAFELKSETAELKISGSGTIHANVANELMARVSGSGNIKYKGNPRIEDVKVSGSGKVSTY